MEREDGESSVFKCLSEPKGESNDTGLGRFKRIAKFGNT